MADNTPFSVRMENDDKEKLLQLIQESGRSNKDFMSVLVSSYELNKVKFEIPDIAKDIEGLQALTQRINDYYVNIGKRIEDVQKSKDLEFTKELDLHKSRIDDLQEKIKLSSEKYSTLKDNYDKILGENEELRKQFEQFEQNLKDKSLLVIEYKQKNDTMISLLDEYKQYKLDLEVSRKLVSDLQLSNIEFSNSIKEKDSVIEKLNNDIELIKQDREIKLQELSDKYIEANKADKEKVELQRDKAILELQTHHQQQICDLQDKHNLDIQSYQYKYKELLQELELSSKNSVNAKKKKVTNNDQMMIKSE